MFSGIGDMLIVMTLSNAKAMIQGSWAHPFLYFSMVFFTLHFWQVFNISFSKPALLP